MPRRTKNINVLNIPYNELVACKHRDNITDDIIEAINSLKNQVQKSNDNLIDTINTLNTNINSLLDLTIKQNNDLLKQNQLIMKLLDDNNINDEDILPKRMLCPNCSKEFYSTNKSYHEDKKCPYCNQDLSDIKPLKIKKTKLIEEGICPYCESKVHTNDLICPHCYEKLTPVYDELMEEKSCKEKEMQEEDKKQILDNEEELFEYYCRVGLNENYSKKEAIKEIIFKYGISDINSLEEMWESKEWEERLNDIIKSKEQSIKFINEKEDELFECYRNLIINENYSKKDAEVEVLKKYNITDKYVIEKLDDGTWSKWNNKIRKEKLEKEKAKNSKACPKCGIENELDNNFCISCGNKL